MTKPPIPLTALPADWIPACREAMNQRESVPVRAHPKIAAIEAWSVNRGRWMEVLLPGGGTTFETAGERDGVLAALTAPNVGSQPRAR